MKFISWNVNGIRALLKKGFVDIIKKENPHILCIQETKSDKIQIGLEGYYQYWNSADKKGYSGTAVFTNIKPLKVSYDMKGHDNEGRIITLEFAKFFLVNVYTPNSQRGLTRLDYRQRWDADFLDYVLDLEKIKPVVFCGDLNVAHKDIDLARPKQNQKNAGFTIEERYGFDRYIESGFIDSFREFNKEPENYSWWSYMFNARAKNIGWRIDYFLISKMLKKNLKDGFILPNVMGSDHCPVGIKLEF
ncbi:exodeoxyribonuclease III [Candidatus Woesearchaeota archaeon]|nr:exodeoxyribonuclease III [Candidatus Woesearchaeota archaeon]